MIITGTSQPFEATAEGFATGLVGTIGVRIIDNAGATVTARATGGIIEYPAGSGFYQATLTAPASTGVYSVFWDDGVVGPGHDAAEDLLVNTTTVSVAPPAPPGPAGSLTLTYADQRAAIYERRFPTSSPVSQWLAAAYLDVWNSHPWTFKDVSREQWYTTDTGLVGGAPAQQPLMPAAFSRVTGLYDDQGYELLQLTQHEFEHAYAPITSTGKPEAFSVVNRRIILGPAPDSAYPFQVSYRRRLATRTAALTVQTGFYQADTDLPLWDDHHYLLVLRAKLIGLRDRSDPTAADLQAEYAGLLEAMREDYGTAVWGRQLAAWQ